MLLFLLIWHRKGMGSTSICAKAAPMSKRSRRVSVAQPGVCPPHHRPATARAHECRQRCAGEFECLPERRGGFHYQTQPAPGVAGRMADDRQERWDVL